MSAVCVCVVAYGHAYYLRAARHAVNSVLARSDFDVFLAAGPGAPREVPSARRVTTHHLPTHDLRTGRAAPFLLKFRALAACLDRTSARYLMLLDADAIFRARVDVAMVTQALGTGALAMVEQTTIAGSGMTRQHFLDHYTRHTLAWFAPGSSPPPLEAFRYYNTGMVLGTRDELRELTSWALATIDGAGSEHAVGQHMIADQDYFQFWAHAVHPSRCRALPWRWNHCEHWDDGFPRSDAVILHFSNFCNGLTRRQLWRMRWHNRRPAWRWLWRGDRAAGGR
jgi:hypothetical protein